MCVRFGFVPREKRVIEWRLFSSPGDRRNLMSRKSWIRGGDLGIRPECFRVHSLEQMTNPGAIASPRRRRTTMVQSVADFKGEATAVHSRGATRPVGRASGKSQPFHGLVAQGYGTGSARSRGKRNLVRNMGRQHLESGIRPLHSAKRWFEGAGIQWDGRKANPIPLMDEGSPRASDGGRIRHDHGTY